MSGGLRYPIQVKVPLVGSKDASFALTTSTLTADYADNRKVIESAGMSKLDIRFSYTTGAAETNNSVDILVEESADGTNWFSIVNESVSAGVSTINDRNFNYADNTGSAANKKSSIGLDIFYDKIRVSFKEAGVSSNFGTIYAEGTLLGL